MSAGEVRPLDARTVLALTVGALAIGFAAPLFRRAAPIDPMLASAVRLALAGLLMSPAIPRAQARGRLAATTIRWAAVAGALYAVHFGTWVASLGLTSVTASVTLVTATPLLLAVVGWLAGRDAPDRRLWLGLALAGLGTLVIGMADASGPEGALVGDLLALVGAIAMAAILLVIRREQTRLDALSFSSIAAFVGALCLALVLVARGAIAGVWPEAPTLASLAWVAATAVISQLVGHTALTWALQHASPTVVALATTTEPIFAAVITFAWLGEVPATLVIVGSAITLLGVVLGMTRPRTVAPSTR